MPRHTYPRRSRSRAQLARAERARQEAAAAPVDVSGETLARRLVTRGLATVDILDDRRFTPPAQGEL